MFTVKKKIVPKLYDVDEKLKNPESFDLSFGNGGPFKYLN